MSVHFNQWFNHGHDLEHRDIRETFDLQFLGPHYSLILAEVFGFLNSAFKCFHPCPHHVDLMLNNNPPYFTREFYSTNTVGARATPTIITTVVIVLRLVYFCRLNPADVTHRTVEVLCRPTFQRYALCMEIWIFDNQL
ncbi:hypothetical protein D3C75_1115640 [compost metagenome]